MDQGVKAENFEWHRPARAGEDRNGLAMIGTPIAAPWHRPARAGEDRNNGVLGTIGATALVAPARQGR